MQMPLSKCSNTTKDKKERLFRTAEELLHKKDYDKITVRDIVKGAGVSIGTFYKYYNTKIEVFYETFQFADTYFQEVVSHQQENKPCRERLLGFVSAYARYSGEMTDIKLTKLLFHPDNRFFHRDPNQGMIAVLTRIIQDGIDQKDLLPQKDSAEEISLYIMISLRGLIYHWCTCGGSYDLEEKMLWYAERLLTAYVPAYRQE